MNTLPADTDRAEACAAMRTAASIDQFDLSASIAESYKVPICPVCVSNSAGDGSMLVAFRESVFWICETCAEYFFGRPSGGYGRVERVPRLLTCELVAWARRRRERRVALRQTIRDRIKNR